ncbi:hypothetical protein [Dinoroseobacter sp. S124A]|uniref:hypothetical protein n=1 Tax=Dinoroseobacter sp. S124A TaxID=3415128 RepID=UPI003C7B0516
MAKDDRKILNLSLLRRAHDVLTRVAMYAFPLVSAFNSYKSGDWTWFARSGSAMVALSIWMFAMAYLLDQRVAIHGLRPGDPDPTETLEAIDNMKRASSEYRFAAYAAISGTLIWGYGDLLGSLF